MAKFYAYLRVSCDGQDWRKRKLGALIKKAERGDVLLTPEFSRIAGSSLAVLEILKAASERGLIVHVTKQNLIMDGSLQSDIIATILGMVAQIERHLIQERTKEALNVARQRGIKLGRPKGSIATQLKLDNHIDEIQAFTNVGLSQSRIAKTLGVSVNTLRLFIERKNIKPTKIKPLITMPRALEN
ncbi:recombinase family protein [Bartonella raoultii]|uniref:Recombinase family protein n=1 Tax=Bartonella raoultii TaxID=1457020 RepID=A0ABS7I6S3_9HYPH|nr:recombinase family protein [Bartonella raoultii]MBX4336619.1 recombinase family protein [Bartonella raoultii]